MLQTINKTEKQHRERVTPPQTSLEAQVGNTPLLRLHRVAAAAGLPDTVQLYAKAEWFNPSGSIKDRPALNIIRTAEWDALLRPGMILLDSTSGNMGIAYAVLGAAKGYRVKLTLPEHASPERVAILRAHGAELLFTDPLEGSDGAILEARRLAAEAPDTVYFHDGQRNLGSDWRPNHALCGRFGHQWHFRRDDPAVERAKPLRRERRRAARGSVSRT
jgi:cysteine synthase B